MLLNDLHYGIRRLLKQPAFTLLAITTLALGIAASSAIFSVVNAVLLKPLPYKDSERLTLVEEVELKHGSEMPVAPPTYMDWREQAKSFADLAAYTEGRVVLTGEGEPESIDSAFVTANYFGLLGLRPIAGRDFVTEEDTPAGNPVVIIGNNLWRRRFNGESNVIGRSITLDDKSYQVVGVAPEGFAEPGDAELWLPLTSQIGAEAFSIRGAHMLVVIGRLRPSIKPAEAEAELKNIAQHIAESDTWYKDFGARVTPWHEAVTGNVQRPLWIMLAAVGFVLLIACANVANLLLAQTSSRRREIAVRLALGASRWRLIRQMLTESILLAVIAGGFGLLLAKWGTDLIVAFNAENLPRAKEIGLDARVTLATLLMSVATGVIFGLAPTLQTTKTNLVADLRHSGTTLAGNLRSRLGSLLITGEVALTFVLLIGAALMINSFLRLLRVDPGYKPEHVVSFRIVLPESRYDDKQKRATFFKDIIDRIQTVAGVSAVGGTTNLPTSGQNMSSPVTIEGRPQDSSGPKTLVQYVKVERNYFQAMSIPLLRGRLFDERDTPEAPPVVVINDALARKSFPGEDPIGKRLKTMFHGRGMREVIGVVGDIRHAGPIKEAPPQVYEPFQENPLGFMTLVVRGNGSRPALIAAVRSTVQSIDPNLPIERVAPMRELLFETVAEPRFYTLLLGIFAAIACVLAAVGIYGVVAYSVSQRTQEMGIRMALGARSRDVVLLVMRENLRVIGAGLVIGLIAALALTRLLTGILHGLSATDPATFAITAALLLGVAVLASYLPARRATRVDPLDALRYE